MHDAAHLSYTVCDTATDVDTRPRSSGATAVARVSGHRETSCSSREGRWARRAALPTLNVSDHAAAMAMDDTHQARGVHWRRRRAVPADVEGHGGSKRQPGVQRNQ